MYLFLDDHTPAVSHSDDGASTMTLKVVLGSLVSVVHTAQQNSPTWR